MSKYLTGKSSFADALCIAIGEEPTKVRAIKLDCSVNAVVTVTVEKYVTDEQGARILDAIKKHTWVEEPEKEEENA